MPSVDRCILTQLNQPLQAVLKIAPSRWRNTWKLFVALVLHIKNLLRMLKATDGCSELPQSSWIRHRLWMFRTPMSCACLDFATSLQHLTRRLTSPVAGNGRFPRFLVPCIYGNSFNWWLFLSRMISIRVVLPMNYQIQVALLHNLFWICPRLSWLMVIGVINQ